MVIKVRRPGIEKMIEVDFSIMKMLVSQAEKMSDDVKFLGISRVVDGFAISLKPEINFNIEALNCQRFSKVIESYDTKKTYRVPKIYPEYTRENLLVMEFLDGIPFTDVDRILERIEAVKPNLAIGISVFMKTFLSEGFFMRIFTGAFLSDGGREDRIDRFWFDGAIG